MPVLAAMLFLVITGHTVARLFGPLPLPLAVQNRLAPWDDFRFSYRGAGRIICYMDRVQAWVPEGESIEFRPPFRNAFTKGKRNIFVYLPPGYRQDAPAPYPVIFYLHGFTSTVANFIEVASRFEKAMAAKKIPPVILVRSDASISGDTTDDPSTPWNDRAGAWYVNGPACRFEDYFFREFIPFVFSRFNVRKDPGGVVLLGASMGGFGALYYSITHPSLSRVIAVVFPAADLRYGIGGSRIAAYDPGRYAPVETDSPRRIINGMLLGGMFGLTEEFIFYPAFAGPPGGAGKGRPVWERWKEVNPADLLSGGTRDLSGKRYYIIAGTRDDFNCDSQVKVVKPLLLKSGARVFPANNFVPGGRHGHEFQIERMDGIVQWIGEQLGPAKGI